MTLQYTQALKITITLISLLLFSSNVYADSLQNRLEAATELLAKKQEAFYISRVPELKGKLPSWKIDSETRTAISCALNKIKSAKGNAAAEDYVKYVEANANKEFSTFSQMTDVSELPKSLDQDTLLLAMSDCNNIEISNKRLQESGAMEILSDPETIKKLMAD